MKKKLFYSFTIASFLTIIGWNFRQNQQKTGLQVSLENIEALAGGEDPFDCPNGCLTDPGNCYCHYFFPYVEAVW